jgi:hypothetical protein
MSFLDYFDKLPELAKCEKIDDVILNVGVVKIIPILTSNGRNINENFHEGRSLLECTLETFERNTNKNNTQKLLQKIMILIMRGARCPQLYDYDLLVNIIVKCSLVSNRTNFQLITRLGKIFDRIDVDITSYLELCDCVRAKKLWKQTSVHVKILREQRNCIEHINSHNWNAFLENVKLLLSLFTVDYTKNDWCFHTIAQELVQCNWQSDETSIAASCIAEVLNIYPRMVCDIILNIDKHINVSGIMELCAKYYQPSYDCTLLYGLHKHFMDNSITTVVIDIAINFITDTEIILLCDPDFPVRRTLLSELQATQDNFNNSLLSYLEVTLFDRSNNRVI